MEEMNSVSMSFIKNKNILDLDPLLPYAYVTYKIDKTIYTASIIEEIAIGQSLGAWEVSQVDVENLKRKVAKVISVSENSLFYFAKIAFPLELWHGNLSWLLTIAFGKMSFYPQIQLNSIEFSKSCQLEGPRFSMMDIREMLGIKEKIPLLMGILKPNVAMSGEKIAELYFEAAQSGVHLLKDDEIRFDKNELEVLKRIELVAKKKSLNNLKTIYVPHIQINGAHYLKFIKDCENAGADALLINTWTCGLDSLQSVRKETTLPIFSHPALAGAFGFTEAQSTVHPRVSLAQLLRAAGADFTLFPSPYGKLGLPKEIAMDIAKHCLDENRANFKPMIPVPSAGIKPEHAPLAKEDFGTDFVLNAGTGIFSAANSIQENISEFVKRMYS